MSTKYLTEKAVSLAIKRLRRSVHPFVGITFLACKKSKLPVGSGVKISLDGLTNDHLRKYHRIDPKSDFFFQPFKSSTKWVGERYASTGLQTINTQTFANIFLHTRNSRTWGFQPDYVEKIHRTLNELSFSESTPLALLAIWIYKEDPLGKDDSLTHLIERFKQDFLISHTEQALLFSDSLEELSLDEDELFSIEPFVPSKLLELISPAPDSQSGKGKSLKSLKLGDTDIAKNLEIDFGERLSVITGDNGLGKSFLLEFAWKAATGTWADKPIMPTVVGKKARPSFSYEIAGLTGSQSKGRYIFDSITYQWNSDYNDKTNDLQATPIEALCVYSRADGSFAIYDPLRNSAALSGLSGSVFLSSNEVWNGREGVLEGLIRDWVRWERSPDQHIFDKFSSILRKLSPEDLGELRPGPAIRLPGDPRDIPTIFHQYGSVPIIHASAGVQRVLLLSYLLILSWQEHELAADQLSRRPLRRLLLLIDELEAHLHPKWQRIVLPSLMGAAELLSGRLTIQTIAATHSPMILASIEPEFQHKTDVLYHLYTDQGSVRLDELTFVKYGDASGWLTSPVFGLRHARSRQAEKVIERAKSLQLADNVDRNDVEEVTMELKRLLPNEDSFWPRWLFFAESKGVDT